MPPLTTTGDINYRTAGYMARELLKRAQPLLLVTRLGTPKPLPKNSTRTMKFRGYHHLDNQPKALTEGITPQASKPTFHDIEVTINQYGDYVHLTDVLHDTHEDPLISEFSDILGEQSAIMMERITIGALMAGTNVYYSGSVGGGVAMSRAQVNEPLNLNFQRRVLRGLKRQLAQPITNVVSASPNFGTSPIAPGYIAVAHVDLEPDIREMRGFVPVERYGGGYRPLEGELGSVEGVRYCLTTLMEPGIGVGGIPNAGTNVETDIGGTGNANVYPVFYFGKHAFGTIPFAKSRGGASPITPMVLNPNVPRGGDPLGQRGTIGWKAWHAAVILYDAYMARAEVAASSLA